MIDGNGFPQHILVVGGNSEIAHHIVANLAEHSLETAVLLGPNLDNLQDAATRLKHFADLQVITTLGDLGDLDALPDAITHAAQLCPTLDCVLIAGAILGDQTMDEIDPRAVARSLTINSVGPAVALTVVVAIMERQGFGEILVLSSVAGEQVRRSNYLYGVGKAALDGFALALGDRTSPAISVTVVRPGFVRTKMTAGRPAAPFATTPEAVSRDAVAALIARRQLVWSPKVMRAIMAVIRHLPRPLLRRLPI
ncbi:MAG: SDR family NAD(P)-dependent oxidoreductase [Ferrimicrobium sp.]